MPRARSRSSYADDARQEAREIVVAQRGEVADRRQARVPPGGPRTSGPRRAARAGAAPPGTPPRVPAATTVTPAGLSPVGGDLGDDLRRAAAERRREPGRAADLAPAARAGAARLAGRGHDGARQVEVALVDADLLHGRAVLGHERPHGARVAAVGGRDPGARRRPAGSAGAPPPSSSPTARRTAAPRSSRWPRRRGRRGCRRPRAGGRRAPGAPTPRRRRRRRRGRGGRRPGPSGRQATRAARRRSRAARMLPGWTSGRHAA